MEEAGRKVIYFVYEPVHESPPCFAQICILKDLGMDVVVITKECRDSIREIFAAKGIRWIEFGSSLRPAILQKAAKYLHLQEILRSVIRKEWTDETVFWVGSDHTFLVPGQRRLLTRIHPSVLSCLEFYEGEDYQKRMRRMAPLMDVVTACEPNRARYMEDWWKLKERPFVLPNKPYGTPRTRNLPGSTGRTQEAISKMEEQKAAGNRILLYQGILSDRRDLTQLADALTEMDGSVTLVLMGKEVVPGSAERIAQRYQRTLYLGNYDYPLHLEITSHSQIGIAYYTPNSLNNRYCAPNKIYEYAAFGLPMLCNDVPGLTESVGKAGAARCIDFGDTHLISEAVSELFDHYDAFSENSRRFYDQTDNARTIEMIYEKALYRGKERKSEEKSRRSEAE